MLCLTDSIRDDDPCVQRLLCTVEEAHTLPELILAAWAVGSCPRQTPGRSGAGRTCPLSDVVAPLPAMWGMHAQ